MEKQQNEQKNGRNYTNCNQLLGEKNVVNAHILKTSKYFVCLEMVFWKKLGIIEMYTRINIKTFNTIVICRHTTTCIFF